MGTDSKTNCSEITGFGNMRKTLFAFVALIILIIGFAQSVSITRGTGNSVLVSGLGDGDLIQVTGDGYILSNGDGTYKAELPNFYSPAELRNGRITVDITGGTVNQFIGKFGDKTFSYVTKNSHIDVNVGRNIPKGTYSFTVQGKTTSNKISCIVNAYGNKYGASDFTLDFNNIIGNGYANVKVYINNVQQFSDEFYFGTVQPVKTVTVSTTPSIPTYTPTYWYKPKPTPTPTPSTTKTPGQIWAERYCWWYRV